MYSHDERPVKRESYSLKGCRSCPPSICHKVWCERRCHTLWSKEVLPSFGLRAGVRKDTCWETWLENLVAQLMELEIVGNCLTKHRLVGDT